MGVNKGDDDRSKQDERIDTAIGAGHEREQPAGPGQGGGGGPAGPGRSRPGVAQLDSRLSRPMSRSTAGEQVSRYLNAQREILNKELEGRDDFRLIVLDKQQKLTMLSAVLLVHTSQFEGKTIATVYSMIVESSGPQLAPTTLNIGPGQTCEVVRVAGDVADATFWERVVESTKEVLGSHVDVFDAGGQVLPTELDPADSARIRQVLYNAVQATFTVMDNVRGGEEEPFSVAWVDRNERLMARLDYNAQPAENSVGLPVRSDVGIELQGVVRTGDQMMGEQARNLTRIDGFVDLVFAGQQMQQTGWGMMPQQPQGPQPQYYPKLVITQSTSEVDAVTMELLLLALSTSTLMSTNNAWAQIFKPRYVQGPDLRDIGAIGYEVNVTGDPNAARQKIDTKSESFTDQAFQQLLHATVHPALIYAMDIEEFGEQSWIDMILLSAADGNPDAASMVIEAADNLTNGCFSRRFVPENNGPIAYNDHNRIHLGYYTDDKGQLRDVRDIDYLAMLNLAGESNMDKVVEFAETYYQTNTPIELRLERRLKLLQALLGETLRIKGYARRITFNPDFVFALQAAAADAGLVIQPTNTYQDLTGSGQHGDPNAGNMAVSPFQSGLFNPGSNSPFPGARGFGMPMGGWGGWGRR